MQVDIDTSRIAVLADSFGASIKQMRKAEVRALNKTLRWVVKNIIKNIGREAKLPAKLLRQRIRAFKATTRNRSGRVWAGLQPLMAHRLGAVRQMKRGGVRAGRHRFDNAFVHTTSNNKLIVFQRTGEAKRLMKKGRYADTRIKREPVDKAKLDLHTSDVQKVVNEWFGKAQAQFFIVFKRELNYEVFVKNG